MLSTISPSLQTTAEDVFQKSRFQIFPRWAPHAGTWGLYKWPFLNGFFLWGWNLTCRGSITVGTPFFKVVEAVEAHLVEPMKNPAKLQF